MEISRYGPRSFYFVASALSVITDPPDDVGSLSVDVVISSTEPDESSESSQELANRRLIQGPGEYEIADVFIHGIRTYRDTEKGATHGRNTAYSLTMDSVRLCYLGHIGHPPTSDNASSIGDVDVLLVPFGQAALDTAAVAETVGILEPRLILPIGEPTQADLEALAKELGVPLQPPSDKLSLTHSTLPPEPQVTILTT